MKLPSTIYFLKFSVLVKLLLVLAVIIQVFVFFYTYNFELHSFVSVSEVVIRFFRSVALSFIILFFISVLNIFTIQYLNTKLYWDRHPVKRLLIQFLFTSLIAEAVAIPITLIENFFEPYPMGLKIILITNGIITIVINCSIMILLEAWYYYLENSKTVRINKRLENELSQIRFEVLKSQLNPHFIFNCLNVLSTLIEKDIKKSQQFINEFSHMYRYVLETIEKQVVTLEDELNFVNSYIFLQQIRHERALLVTINVAKSDLNLLLPPLSIQVVIENVIKHNSISSVQPLHIEIESNSETLMVKNNIQNKISASKSTGLGQLNLVKRYSMITEKVPTFRIENNHYLVKLPLTKKETYESNYH